MMRTTFLNRVPFHPILWGILPLLIFFVNNISEVSIDALWRPLGISVLFSLVVFGISKIFIKNWDQSALMASWSLFLFFTYGHVYSLLKDIEISNLVLGRHRLILPLWLVLFTVGAILILRKKNDIKFWTLFLNVMLLSGILLQGLQLGTYFYNLNTTRVEITADRNLAYGGSEPLPDIYLIILDAYGRADVYEKYYQFDNSEFINQLEEFGFEIIPCARSNYEHTAVAIPSLLNMDYMHVLTEDVNQFTSRELLVNNKIRQMLGELGYVFVTFDTQYAWLTIEDADVFYDIETTSQFNFLQPFEVMFIETTGGLIFLDGVAKRVQTTMSELNFVSAKALKAFVELSNIEALNRAIELEGPKFVYAHFMTTHPPFVFDSEGNIIENVEDPELAYVNSTKFISSQVFLLLQKILDESENKPVVIIQGDHGLQPEFRYTILNAIYFPKDHGDLPVYPGMTPVNSFRMIFNQLFSSDFEILEDRYFESRSDWFDLSEIKNIDPYCQIDR
jgi:hypothetical protein